MRVLCNFLLVSFFISDTESRGKEGVCVSMDDDVWLVQLSLNSATSVLSNLICRVNISQLKKDTCSISFTHHFLTAFPPSLSLQKQLIATTTTTTTYIDH